MSRKYIFVIAGSEKCPPCKEFSTNVMPELKPWLTKKGIEWAELKIRAFDVDDFSEIHPYLPEIVSKFPTILMIPLEEWLNRDSELKGYIYWPRRKERTLSNAKEWIRSLLS